MWVVGAIYDDIDLVWQLYRYLKGHLVQSTFAVVLMYLDLLCREDGLERKQLILSESGSIFNRHGGLSAISFESFVGAFDG